LAAGGGAISAAAAFGRSRDTKTRATATAVNATANVLKVLFMMSSDGLDSRESRAILSEAGAHEQLNRAPGYTRFDSMQRGAALVVTAAATALGAALVSAQGIFVGSRNHAAIQYSTRETTDAIAKLNRRLEDGQVRLSFDGARGYLASALTAFDISIDSQTLVYSETSFQSDLITEKTPRALYFNDTVAVGWVQGGDALEAAALDPEQGVIFYTLDQKPGGRPQFARSERCLQCHVTSYTDNVPGFFVMSMLPLSDNQNDYAEGWGVDHRTPIADRWGGWYVTGEQVPMVHLGNVPVYHVPRSYVRAKTAPRLASVAVRFDASPYLSPSSDVAALLVLNHQVRMANLLTRLGWEARVAAHDDPGGGSARVRDTARELVDYLLFVDEAPLPAPVRGATAFSKDFPAKGPRDSKGRSLRELDLDRRLLRYPCSYMIYSEAFDHLPGEAKNAVYERMWAILSGQEQDAAYARLSPADRRAIVEILRDTKKGLPDYFR
jgi:hypothetical protein